jgi:hypothetical protein
MAVLVYVKLAYKNTDGTYEYDMFFSETPAFVWGPKWDVDNPVINGDLTPEESTYSYTRRVETTLPLKTAEETSCLPMEYVTYGILALAWIDIENLDEYPQHGRMTLHFGDSEEDVEAKLAEYDWTFQE